jgi:hypothetical protein
MTKMIKTRHWHVLVRQVTELYPNDNYMFKKRFIHYEQRSMAIENNQPIRDEIEQTISEIVDDIIVEQVTGEIQVTDVLKCEECDFETRMKKQLDTHKILM